MTGPDRSTCKRIAALAEQAASKVDSSPDHDQLNEIARYWRSLAQGETQESQPAVNGPPAPSPSDRADELARHVAETLRLDSGLTIADVRAALDRRFGPPVG